MLSSCKLLETKEGLGAILGAVGGNALCHELAKNTKHRGVISYICTGLGGYIGAKIGKKLDEQDRIRMAKTTQNSLVSGQSGSWSNRENKTKGSTTILSTTSSATPIKVKILKSKVKKVPPLAIIGATYLAKQASNVRGGPSTDYVVVGSLKNQQAVRVVGQVIGQRWFMISEGGAGSGFVHGNLLEAAPIAEVIEQQMDPAEVVEEVIAEKTLCRVIENSVTLADGSVQQEQLTACQGPNGWEVKNTPA
jgi:surface antigen